MPLRSDWSERLCPIGRSLDVLGDPWIMLIVRDVLQGYGRFDQLRRSLGISDPVLSRRLRTMIEAGLLERVDYQDGARTRQGYVATEAAADLLPILQQLALWGEKHTTTPAGGGHMALIHASCGAETEHAEYCSSCGQELIAEEMIWDKTWRDDPVPLVGAGVLGPIDTVDAG